MDFQCLNVNAEIQRPLANFHPDIWGDRFINYSPPDEATLGKWEQEVGELKKLIRKELLGKAKDPKDRLDYLDAIHRLGISYHFDIEIEDNLHMFLKNEILFDNSFENDLYYVSLCFRLLRQNGFYVSCDVFKNFKNDNGRFKECLRDDIKGLLSLYEASFLRIHGEHLLDEALVYATTHLTTLASQLDNHMAEEITRALELPLHKRSLRVESKYQISIYELNSCHDKTLLRFAKLDFNLLQVAHRLELQEFMRWSKRLDSVIKLPNFMRNRVVECYFWTLAAYHEPKYAFARLCLSKMLRIISIIDDMYDAYATTKELESFTAAFQRWDKRCTNQLPDYMQSFYEATIDTFDEIEQELAKEDRKYAIYYARQQLVATCKAYFQEAKWRHAKTIPTYDEYTTNGVFSAGNFFVIAASYLGMGYIANEDAFKWLNPGSKAPKASCIFTRLLDDIAGHKHEQNRDHVASSVETYINQFGTSEAETYEHIQMIIEEAWKDMNEDMLRPTQVSMPLLTRVINLSRLLNDFLKLGQDGYTMPKYAQPKIEAALLDSFPLNVTNITSTII